MGTEKKTIRLDKYLADMNVGSRKDIKQAARKGRITLNGEICKTPEIKVQPETDRVCYDGAEIGYHHYEYYMLNKPAGVVSAVKDNLYQTVVDLIDIKYKQDLFPVGRLDIDTEGLLLLTNDGALAHQLLAPKKHVDKVYYAKVTGNIPDNCVLLFKNGLILTDKTAVMPANLTIISQAQAGTGDSFHEIQLTLHEGKFHQVKRMFEAVGCQVVYLKRISMGSLQLDEQLMPGGYRKLTETEIKLLKAETESR